MKKVRLLAWLLVIAMLSLTCAALGEDLNVELADGAALPAELELEGDEAFPDIVDPDGLALELPQLDLADDLSEDLDVAPEADANGAEPKTFAPFHYAGDAMDNDRLFAGYVDLLFGKKPKGDLRPNGFLGDTLTGVTKRLYDCLVPQIKKVAAGTISSTIFDIPSSVATSYDWDEIEANIVVLHDALLNDLPYHLYWYDKTQGFNYNSDDDGSLYFMFVVADAYADWSGDVYDGCCFSTNSAKIRSAQTAVTNAKRVVKKYASVSDYKKLCGYRDYICQQVDYNDDAVADENYPYGDPWQLIWAFDGDLSTDIVCEGYSKAFQYLCDLSSFSTDIQCHIVTGTEYDRGGSGAHMWNIVTMGDGKNYHVDITFVDGGYTAAFLCGAAQTEYENTYLVRNELYYQLDSYTVSVYPAKTLRLSTKDYDPKGAVLPKSITLKKGNTKLKKGQKISLKRGKSLTLKAVVSPSKASTKLTWKSSYRYVTVNNGKVTVNKKAKAGTKAKITVTTSNKMSTYIYIVVK